MGHHGTPWDTFGANELRIVEVYSGTMWYCNELFVYMLVWLIMACSKFARSVLDVVGLLIASGRIGILVWKQNAGASDGHCRASGI